MSHDHDHDDHDNNKDHKGHNHAHSKGSMLPLALSTVTFAIGLYLRFTQGDSLISDGLLAFTAILSGYQLAILGIKNLIRANININLLITIASIGAFIIGHPEEGAAVVYLYSIAEKLEEYAEDKARRSIESLMELKPEIAILKKNGVEIEVPVEEVFPGDVFVVKPGDRIPLDGRVLEGNSSVNQATITGESSPISKDMHDDVYAGTINIDGFLVVRVQKMAGETVLARILELVEEAEDRRSPTEAFVDKFAHYYTPAVIISAVLVAILPTLIFGESIVEWVYRALVMLVVACPCALAISTPIAMVSSIASASRNGVLVKGSTYMEQVSKTKVIAFDKTGTLTMGELGVSDIISNTHSDKEVLRIAVSLESKSKHPIAHAITEKAKELGVEIEETKKFKAYIGRGVEACIDNKTCCIGNLRLFDELEIPPLEGVIERLELEGKTVVFVSEEGCTIGAIALMDKVRETAHSTVHDLKDLGYRVEMLTGDNEKTAKTIVGQLHLDGFKAQLLPEEKVKAIDELKAKYGSIIMVGDGVNDAPALATADVGIAMGAIGSDVALETADIALMEDDISKIVYLVKLSKATMARIRENITLSILVKLGVAVLAFFGIVSLWIAVAVGDMGLSLTVILNSLRLSGIKAEDNYEHGHHHEHEG